MEHLSTAIKTGDVTLKIDSYQTGAVRECIVSNDGDAAWNSDAGQAATTPKRGVSNAGDAAWNRNAGQAGAAIESPVTDTGDAAWNHWKTTTLGKSRFGALWFSSVVIYEANARRINDAYADDQQTVRDFISMVGDEEFLSGFKRPKDKKKASSFVEKLKQERAALIQMCNKANIVVKN